MLPYALAAIFALFFLVASGAFLASIYNRMLKLDQECENGFGQIKIQLMRRYDLIPNLVASVRAYMQHEHETLEQVIAARNQASSQLESASKPGAGTAGMQQWMEAEGVLSSALGKMSFVMEDYPELKADKNVAALMEELTSTENRISFARQAYNDWCTTFNIYRQSFPNVVFAGTFGYSESRLLLEFENEETMQHAPQVDLSMATT